MAIKSISVKNFTVFDKIKIDFCGGVNIFLGENGTGKTHLLKLLYASNVLFSSDFQKSLVDLFGKDVGINNCELRINDELTPWSATIVNGVIQPSTAQIDVDIDSKMSSVFIPVKEVLSMSNLTRVDDEYKKKVDIDVTILDIIEKAKKLMPVKHPDFALKIVNKLEKEISGKVFFDEKDETFWIHKTNGNKIPFTSEAEGFRKLGLLWQLIMNKSIKENTTLFWDEPEANINPKTIPLLVEILMELARNGVQIFLATHDYNLVKYFTFRKKASDKVLFHGLYKETDDSPVLCDSKDDAVLLKYNPIYEAAIQILEDKYDEDK